MRPIAVFYHCLFALNTPENVLDRALNIVQSQMGTCTATGLVDAAQHFIVGINGGVESKPFADLILPAKAVKVFHGLESHAENLTIVEMEKWVKGNPGWNVFYFHAKGATHPPGDKIGEMISDPWRDKMMQILAGGWQQCVQLLDAGYESVGADFLTGMCDGTQNYWAGNIWWARSEFLQTLPSIFLRDRIKVSGIAHADSRYEAEVWIGNGPRLPHRAALMPGGWEWARSLLR